MLDLLHIRDIIRQLHHPSVRNGACHDDLKILTMAFHKLFQTFTGNHIPPCGGHTFVEDEQLYSVLPRLMKGLFQKSLIFSRFRFTFFRCHLKSKLFAQISSENGNLRKKAQTGKLARFLSFQKLSEHDPFAAAAGAYSKPHGSCRLSFSVAAVKMYHVNTPQFPDVL